MLEPCSKGKLADLTNSVDPIHSGSPDYEQDRVGTDRSRQDLVLPLEEGRVIMGEGEDHK